MLTKILDYFTKEVLPVSAFQVNSGYLSGVRINPKDHMLKNHFIHCFDEPVISPSFSKKNFHNKKRFEEVLKKNITLLGINGKKVGLLLPEVCQKLFIFSFDNLPNSQKEKEQVIWHRIKKQMPMLVESSRLSFKLIKKSSKIRIIASIAKKEILQEYEQLFSDCGLEIGVIASPIIGLYHGMKTENKKNVLLINIEPDSISLLALIKNEIVLSRKKGMIITGKTENGHFKSENIIQEIDNTMKYIEDHEKNKIDDLLIRTSHFGENNNLFSTVGEYFNCPVKEYLPNRNISLSLQEKRILSPLLGFS